MKYLILSDTHSNEEALRAVLAHAARKTRDAVLFLGDAVGYGGSPNRVVERLRDLKGRFLAVRGNHDRVVLDPSQGAVFFNAHARHAAAWNGEVLTGPNRAFLRRLPQGPRQVEPGILICHGSPYDEDEYVFTDAEAAEAFAASPAGVTFLGHSHVPCLFELTVEDGRAGIVGQLLRGSRVSIDLSPDRRYLVNPGSVGQPRDRDARASYGIYDSSRRRFTLYRVPYDVEAARQRILAAGLPEILGDRLLHGS